MSFRMLKHAGTRARGLRRGRSIWRRVRRFIRRAVKLVRTARRFIRRAVVESEPPQRRALKQRTGGDSNSRYDESRIQHFQCCSFNRSDTCPRRVAKCSGTRNRPPVAAHRAETAVLHAYRPTTPDPSRMRPIPPRKPSATRQKGLLPLGAYSYHLVLSGVSEQRGPISRAQPNRSTPRGDPSADR